MQQLMADFIISLDGYGAAEGWPGCWSIGYRPYRVCAERHAGTAGAPSSSLTAVGSLPANPPSDTEENHA